MNNPRNPECSAALLLLSSRLDGEVTPDGESRLEGHLADCAACRDEERALARTDALAGQALASIREEVADRGAAIRAEALKPRLWPRLVPLLAVAALALLVLAWPPGKSGDEETPVAMFRPGSVSCEIDPRGVSVAWNAITAADVAVIEIERFDATGNRVVFEADVDETEFLDDQIQPGEDYFYAVRSRKRDGLSAYLGHDGVAVNPNQNGTSVSLEGGSEHQAWVELRREVEGQTVSGRFFFEVGQPIQGTRAFPGRGMADFPTDYVLHRILWQVERVKVEWIGDRPVAKDVTSNAIEIVNSEGRVTTLWMRENSSLEE